MKFNILILLAALLLLYACSLVIFNFYRVPKPLPIEAPLTEFKGELWSPHITVTSTPNTNIWPVSQPKQSVPQATKTCYKLEDQITYCE